MTHFETHKYIIMWYFAFQLFSGFILEAKLAEVELIDHLRILAIFS